MNYNQIITNFMDVTNGIIDECFRFLPEILRIFALTILMLMVSRRLDSIGKKWGIGLKWVINIFFAFYSLLRLIPIEEFDFFITLENPYEIALIMLNFLPYFSLIILGKIIKKFKIVKFFINYHVIHLIFLVICVIFYNIDSNSINIEVSIFYIVVIYLIGFSKGAKK